MWLYLGSAILLVGLSSAVASWALSGGDWGSTIIVSSIWIVIGLPSLYCATCWHRRNLPDIFRKGQRGDAEILPLMAAVCEDFSYQNPSVTITISRGRNFIKRIKAGVPRDLFLHCEGTFDAAAAQRVLDERARARETPRSGNPQLPLMKKYRHAGTSGHSNDEGVEMLAKSRSNVSLVSDALLEASPLPKKAFSHLTVEAALSPRQPQSPRSPSRAKL